MYSFKLFVLSPITLICGVSSFVLDMVYLVWLSLQVGFRDEQFFLHYNILSGVDWVGPASMVYWIPCIGLSVLVANMCLSWYLFKHRRDVAYIVLVNTVCIHLFLGIATYMVVFLNV